MFNARKFEYFEYKEAAIKLCANPSQPAKDEIVRQRLILEKYIQAHPEFKNAFSPLPIDAEAPEVVRRMSTAAHITGLGPMAAVAGTMAQLAAEAAMQAGSPEAIVENGGDIFARAKFPLTIGMLAGSTPIADQLAFYVAPELCPIAICASSATMGHSTSLGRCDLAVAVSGDAALADAAATLAANLVTSVNMLEPAANRVGAIEGISGVFLVKDEKIAMAGRLPKLIKIH